MRTLRHLADRGVRVEDTFLVLAGPCVVEGYDITLRTAEYLVKVCDGLGLPLVFKSSYRKANRSRVDSFQGLGDGAALGILSEVKRQLGVRVVTDIHLPEEAILAAEVADVLQIPAFLCRQTDLLEAAARTGKVVNIKKGQFLSAESMGFAAKKVRASGNERVMLTERGTTFGYGDLVVDFRGVPVMRGFDVPVIVDVTHSLQRPNQVSGVTGGRPDLIEHMAMLTVASGADGIFFETHPNPSEALSDGANMLPLDRVEAMLCRMVGLYRCYHNQ